MELKPKTAAKTPAKYHSRMHKT